MPTSRKNSAARSRPGAAAAGLGAALFAALVGGAALGVTSIPTPMFAVTVGRASAFVADGEARWSVQVTPSSDADRLTARLDRHTELSLTRVGDAGLTVALAGLTPGYHFIEASVARRGERVDRVVDFVFAGPVQAGRDRGCDVALGLSPDAVQMLLLPAIEHKVIAGATAEPLFGATSHITRSQLSVVEDGFAFEVDLDTTEPGKGDLRIRGEVEVRSVGDRGLSLRLRALHEAAPGPKLLVLAEDQGGTLGRRAGAGGGVVVGAVVGGPVGAVVGGIIGAVMGNEVGERVGVRHAGKRTQSETYDALIEGLSVATQELRLPADVALIRTERPVVADLRWCGPLSLRPDEGLRAAVSLSIVDDQTTAQRVAVFHDTPAVAVSAISMGRNASLVVSNNFINRLLAEWTVRGGFARTLAEASLDSAVEAELGARTRWRVQSVVAELPPVLALHRDVAEISLAGVVMRLVDPKRANTRDIVAGGVAALRLRVDAGATARFDGRLSQAYFGCRLPDREGRVLPSCFAAAVDPEMIRKKVNVAIMLNSGRLPSIDLARLLELRVTEAVASSAVLQSADLWAGEGVLRLEATLCEAAGRCPEPDSSGEGTTRTD